MIGDAAFIGGLLWVVQLYLIYCKPYGYIFLTSPPLSQLLFKFWRMRIPFFVLSKFFTLTCIKFLKQKIKRD